MRFSHERELAIVHQLDDRNAHLVLDPDDYGPNGTGPVVHRNGTSQLLHRFLYDRVVAPMGGELRDRFLIPDCDEPLCRNPWHRIVSDSPRQPVQHAGQKTPRTRRPTMADINRAKTECDKGHKFTKDNTYEWVDSKGRIHRKCRICTLRRTRAQHTANRERNNTP